MRVKKGPEIDRLSAIWLRRAAYSWYVRPTRKGNDVELNALVSIIQRRCCFVLTNEAGDGAAGMCYHYRSREPENDGIHKEARRRKKYHSSSNTRLYILFFNIPSFLHFNVPRAITNCGHHVKNELSRI
jgi:hypothetical protein